MNAIFEELRAAAFSIWQRRWIALGVAWAVCVAGWIVVAFLPNQYQSKARIYVQLEDVLSEQIGIANTGKRDIARVRQTLTSAVNLEKVIKSTRLGELVKTSIDMEVAVANLAKRVEIKSDEDNLFEITAKVGSSAFSDAENARLAQSVTQKLIDLFREQNISGSRGEVASTVVFLDQQLEERKRELDAADQRRIAFEAANPDLIGGGSALSSRMQNLRIELRSVDSDLVAARSALASIDGQLSNTPRSYAQASNSGSAALLTQSQAQLAAMQARGLTDSHPDYVATKRQIAILARQVAAESAGNSGPINPAYSALMSIKTERQAQVQALTARKASLQSDLTSLMASQATEPAVSAEAERISRDYKVLKDKYDELLNNREELRLRGQVENERSAFKFEVIDPPTLPLKPAAPNRLIFIIAVLFAGIAAGGGAAFVMAQLQSVFNSTARLEQVMDLPVIGAISLVMSDEMRQKQKRETRYFFAGTCVLGAMCGVIIAVELFKRAMIV